MAYRMHLDRYQSPRYRFYANITYDQIDYIGTVLRRISLVVRILIDKKLITSIQIWAVFRYKTIREIAQDLLLFTASRNLLITSAGFFAPKTADPATMTLAPASAA